MINHYRAFALLILFFVTNISAQHYPFRHYTADEGLAGNDVISLCIDRRGYLWLGTYNGLDRFDGKNFVNYSTSTSKLGGNIINHVVEDSEGTLWVGFTGGFARLTDNQLTNYIKKDGLAGTEVFEILPLEGKLWLATDAGVECFNGKTFTRYPLEMNDWPSFLAPHMHTVFAESNGRLFKYDTRLDQFIDAGADVKVEALHQDSRGNLYLIDAQNLYLYTPEGVRLIAHSPLRNGLIDFTIQDDKIWLCSDDQIWYHSSAGDKLFDSTQLEMPSISSLAVDREGNLWIAKWGGLSILLSSEILNYQRDLPGRRMTSSLPGNDSFWVSGDHGICHVANSGEILKSIESPYINSIVLYNDAIIASDIESVKEYSLNGTLRRVLFDGPGNVVYNGKEGLYLGTQRGLYLKKSGSLIFIADASSGLASNQIWGIAEKGSQLLVGTENGLSVLAGGTWHTYGESEGLPGKQVSCIINDEKRGTLIATSGGIARWDTDGVITTVLRTTDPVYSLCTDTRGALWIGTSRGLLRMSGGGQTLTIDRSRGLPGVVQHIAVLGDYVYVSTDRGVSRIENNIDFDRDIPPLVEITQTEVNNEPVTLSAFMKPLSSRENSIAFTFGAIYMYLPEEIRYSFRLLGYQDYWTSPSDYSKGMYTNLPPNNYTFQVRAIAEDGKTSEVKSLSFTIDPPLWAQWWFFIPMIFAAGAVIIFLIRRVFDMLLKVRVEEIKREELVRRNELIEKDLKLARQIQHCLMPSKESGNISFFYCPVDIVGGDLFDIVQFPGSDKIGIFITDVSGHGVAAAFITTMIKSFFVNCATPDQKPSAVLHELNANLFDRTMGNFITAFYALYSPTENTIEFSNAGHNPPFLLTKEGVSYVNGIKSRPLCITPNDELEERRPFADNLLQLSPGDKILFYTDGLTEAVNVNGGKRFFEEPLAEEILSRLTGSSSREIVQTIIASLFEFRGSDSFDDDVCFICLEA